MSPARDVCLTLNDVEEMVTALERQYGMSSAEFFRNEEARRTLPEDDVFRWEALIDHRLALRDSYQAVRSEYLARLTQSPEPEVRSETDTQELLAA